MKYFVTNIVTNEEVFAGDYSECCQYVGIHKEEEALNFRVIREDPYMVIINKNENDNILNFFKSNTGFGAYEILGFLELLKYDILANQVRGDIKPENIKRLIG